MVRLSGPSARQIGQQIARRSGPTTSHQLKTASIRNATGELLDLGLVVEMWAPRSYTGEDVVEFHLHGSRPVVVGVEAACVALGARRAGAGEFTWRAFVNGRMDLAQAEAVAELIGARDQNVQRAAAAQLSGLWSRTVEQWVSQLERILAEWQAGLDFPEDVAGASSAQSDWRTIDEVNCKIQAIVDQSQTEWVRGPRVVLCGAPNVGKSTLLNAWAGEERVLVDVGPGTTRDPVEIELAHGMSRLWVCDTAGIGEPGQDGLAARSMDMARERMQHADVAFWLVAEDSRCWPESDFRVKVVGAKADLVAPGGRRELEREASERGLLFAGWVSGKTGEGVSALLETLWSGAHGWDEDGARVANKRQVDALKRAGEGLGRILADGGAGYPMDVLCLELERATQSLGEILGREVGEEVLEQIFSRFCVGK